MAIMGVCDGGPTFPRPRSGDNRVYAAHEQSGVSLRDYLAGQALTGLLANPKGLDCYSSGELAAMRAYAYADAMIKASKVRE